jgi:tetratricopeptide (TPR) repeat protein
MRMPTVFIRHPLAIALRWAFVAAALSAPLAHADDYSEVTRLMRAGQLPEAMAKADQYLATKPRDPQMRFIKGVVQTEAGKTNEAISTFTQITQDYPELPEPYNNLAVLYAGQSQFDKARAALEMAIRTNPSYATAHENLGDVYARLASQAYGKALQLDSSNAAVQPKLALIRNLFTVDTKATQKPVAAAPVTTTPAAVPAPKPAVPASAPAVAVVKPAPAVVTPPATVPTTPTPATPATANAGDSKEVEAAVRAWAQAWSSKDVSAYLGSYGSNFDTPGKQARKAWESDRRARIVGKSSISVKLSNLAVNVQGNRATAKFKQDYSADALNVSSRKTLDLAKVGERWVIVKESTGG